MSSKYKTLPKPDRELIDGFIKKMDPKFNRVEALKKRRELIGEQPPLVIVETLEQIKIWTMNSFEKMIRDFSPDIRHRLKTDHPEMSDSAIDETINKWAEHERKLAIEGIEKEFKACENNTGPMGISSIVILMRNSHSGLRYFLCSLL